MAVTLTNAVFLNLDPLEVFGGGLRIEAETIAEVGTGERVENHAGDAGFVCDPYLTRNPKRPLQTARALLKILSNKKKKRDKATEFVSLYFGAIYPPPLPIEESEASVPNV